MTLHKSSATSSGLTTTAVPYTIGDTVGNRFTFANVADWNQGFSVIRNCDIIDAAGVLGACELHLFGGNVTFSADNAPASISDADALLYLGTLNFAAADSTLLALNSILKYAGKDLYVRSAPTGSVDITGHLVCRAAIAQFVAATDLQIDLVVDSGRV